VKGSKRSSICPYNEECTDARDIRIVERSVVVNISRPELVGEEYFID
jgi:hypothetical protein